MIKEIFVWQHPKKLYNKYFFKNKDYVLLDSRFKILEGIFILFLKLIFNNFELFKF